MELYRQEYWRRLPFSSPGYLPNPRIEPGSPALQADALTTREAALVISKGPIFLQTTWPNVTQPTLQKLNELGCRVLSHPPYSPDLSPTDYCFFNHLNNFSQGKCFHIQQETENAFQKSSLNLKAWIFYTKGINLFLIGKNVLIVMVPILINKGVFEPSYSYLKFTVWNCNYIFTNLLSPSSRCLLHNKPINPRDGVLRHGIWIYLESLLTKKMAE